MIHPWHDVTPGEHLPEEFTAVIEIPFGSSVKYELDKRQRPDQARPRALLGRLLPGQLRLHPADPGRGRRPARRAGAVPGSGGPADADSSARAIGLMTMIDGGKNDHKIIAVATETRNSTPTAKPPRCPPHRLTMLRRFFQDYKQLEGKAVEVDEIRARGEGLSHHRRRAAPLQPAAAQGLRGSSQA